MNCESCKVDIAAESAISGRCARCAAKAPAPKAKADPSAKSKLDVEHGDTTLADAQSSLPDNPDHDDLARARTEPAHLGHAHARSEPADHGKSAKHK